MKEKGEYVNNKYFFFCILSLAMTTTFILTTTSFLDLQLIL